MAHLSNLKPLHGSDEYERVRAVIGRSSDALDEAVHRCKNMHAYSGRQDICANEAARAHMLANQLGGQDVRDPVTSPANPLFFRQEKLRIIPQVLRLAERPDYGQIAVATLIGRGMKLSPDEMMRTDASDLKGQLRINLNVCGAANADGWLLSMLHGAFCNTERVFYLHQHLVGDYGMMADVLAVRDRHKYRPRRHDADPDVFQRVRISRKPITDMARALTYIMQGFWPCRWVGTTGDATLTRLSRRRRIPEPYHSQWLLWMHKQKLTDLLLPMHLEVERGMLKVR